jgi:hypothetical protein
MSIIDPKRLSKGMWWSNGRGEMKLKRQISPCLELPEVLK